MRRAVRFLVIAVLLVAGVAARPLGAQTYNPRAIRFVSTDASQPVNAPELLRISGLKQGVPLTKAEIEAALQKLGDSGAFSSLSYSVNDAALTIRLTPAGGGQALPVRFANLVWWTHDELIKILEQRVPLFHGELPLQGNQTGDVEDVLVALLKEKGIPDAHVTAIPSSGPGGAINGVALSITSPEILVGETHFDGAVPEVAAKLNKLDHELAGRNFDRQDVTNTIQQTVEEIFQDAGYLDVKNEPPVFSPPRKDLTQYVVDTQLTLHPGALYRISAVALHPEPPLADGDLRAVLPFKAGDPASASDFRVALGTLARAYAARGYLEAKADATVNRDRSNHTMSYSFTFTPGAQFHLAAVDTSGLSSDLQQEFRGMWDVAPGAVCDRELTDKLRTDVQRLHSRSSIYALEERNLAAHTVVIKLQFRKPENAVPEQGSGSGPELE